MMDQTKATRRDEVLFAFHRECAIPTADQIVDWTGRYPEFADDIRAHAGIMRDWAANGETKEEAVDERMMNRARSRALNAIYKAQTAEQTNAQAAQQMTFDQLLSNVGLDTRQLSRAIDVGRDVLSDLFRGRMRPPIGQRLVRTLIDKLQATSAEFEHALSHSQAHPSVGHASASQKPTVVQCSYEESIRRSSMSAERKSYWLEED